MKRYLLLWLLAGNASGCTLVWEHSDNGWLEGFRVFQGEAVVGTLPADLRTVDCAVAGLIPGLEPITMTAFRGADESERSEPAVFDISVPGGVLVVITVP